MRGRITPRRWAEDPQYCADYTGPIHDEAPTFQSVLILCRPFRDVNLREHWFLSPRWGWESTIHATHG